MKKQSIVYIVYIVSTTLRECLKRTPLRILTCSHFARMETELSKFFLAIWMSTCIYGGGAPVPHSKGPKFSHLLTASLAHFYAFYRILAWCLSVYMPDWLIARYGMKKVPIAWCLSAKYHIAFCLKPALSHIAKYQQSLTNL